MKMGTLTITRKLDQTKIFFEKPSEDIERSSTKSDAKASAKRISACELFSLFTADIIKKDILFFR